MMKFLLCLVLVLATIPVSEAAARHRKHLRHHGHSAVEPAPPPPEAPVDPAPAPPAVVPAPPATAATCAPGKSCSSGGCDTASCGRSRHRMSGPMSPKVRGHRQAMIRHARGHRGGCRHC